VRPTQRSAHRGQAGFTLIELIIALAISLFVAIALTSVIFTSVQASNTAFGRIGAGAEIRAFEQRADDDFAASKLPTPGTCGDQASNPCTTTPIVLDTTSPSGSSAQVKYEWDGSAILDRFDVTSGHSTELAGDVTAFSWYEDSTTQTVVVQMTVTVLSYSETQIFRFHPQVEP
jgi:prepilin-type N-terminal cleavage/methylation domain-containing protein